MISTVRWSCIGRDSEVTLLPESFSLSHSGFHKPTSNHAMRFNLLALINIDTSFLRVVGVSG